MTPPADDPSTVRPLAEEPPPEAACEHLVVLDLDLEPAYDPHGEPMEDVWVLFGVGPEGTLAASKSTPIHLRPGLLRPERGRMPRPPTVWTPDKSALNPVPEAEQPCTVRALAALQSVMAGDETTIDAFALDVLRLGRSAQWREAASTALLGDWAAPFFAGCGLATSAVDQLRAETRDLHRQRAALWRHRINGDRLRSLDFAFGNDLTLYDVIANGLDPYEIHAGTGHGDPRVTKVLEGLTPIERAVATAWANSHVTSWAEAAASVIALAPARCTGLTPTALGERVRRKLKRLERVSLMGWSVDRMCPSD
ncbi:MULTISPECIES: hypothetical protein [unclassified Streptomyces]|uniref:hypothetical protein n=1 Tax=unclassified Streptomyces TaxID=2593676 RepID=UPI0008238BB4|nr:MULTISPECIES: hypothetical protein [unclassified Streptomyces]MYU02080.1 hypothetical protein [Streptomyces sp. SID8350]SCK61493.1 hypothetical protein YUWDRAFT_06145 [Streptomyces sp. AmelKG-D3]